MSQLSQISDRPPGPKGSGTLMYPPPSEQPTFSAYIYFYYFCTIPFFSLDICPLHLDTSPIYIFYFFERGDDALCFGFGSLCWFMWWL